MDPLTAVRPLAEIELVESFVAVPVKTAGFTKPTL